MNQNTKKKTDRQSDRPTDNERKEWDNGIKWKRLFTENTEYSKI